MKKLQVLTVGVKATEIQGIQSTLDILGCNYVCLNNANAALDNMIEHEPDLIVVDFEKIPMFFFDYIKVEGYRGQIVCIASSLESSTMAQLQAKNIHIVDKPFDLFYTIGHILKS